MNAVLTREADDVDEDEAPTRVCDKCGEAATDTRLTILNLCRRTLSSPAEYSEEFWCGSCRGRAEYDDQNADYLRALASGWAD